MSGGGVAGLTFALLLKQALGSAVSISVWDPILEDEPRRAFQPESGTCSSGRKSELPIHRRAFCLAQSGQKLFSSLRLWERLAPAAQPIHCMLITDSRLLDWVRPCFLTFSNTTPDDPLEDPLAYIVYQDEVHHHLMCACREAEIEFFPERLASLGSHPHWLSLSPSSQKDISARLLILADGRDSTLRCFTGIPIFRSSYEQIALVVTISHEKDHHGEAEQHFLPAGPLARLPLRQKVENEYRSSIVWTGSFPQAGDLLQEPYISLEAEIQRGLGQRLGEIRFCDQPKFFPLHLHLAQRFTAYRCALIGDCAHAIHPLAGQGLNLGLRGAQILAHLIAEQMKCGLDPGEGRVLESYQRVWRPAVYAMAATTDALNRLFSNDKPALRYLRDAGLSLVDKSSFIKKFLIRQAEGK